LRRSSIAGSARAAAGFNSGRESCTVALNTPSPEFRMRLLLAIFLPFMVFFTIGRPVAGIICLILQLTLLGWIPAALWAVYALSQYKTEKKIEEALSRR